ncbi:PREDICTED: MAR-binding filament-like protein 1 [Tarenaya hassleriana]|uniref:MAR-binding filament-like protein 1 n=1 Tax=Tarenaya hassleriana TaxID=28532 RepID=UPI00053C1E0C|nr:PREDICTED: MAR-binding filament-like protein 1 [Tarenaya hassleriana]XP_010534446.1 PREDICTED: MAR-binding filament-like protein 1 [Tarenaya hassleriana]XP_010534447.1 PREDICTED: MAR-binding filament-like protein 1 [Tarenaya hassleriana]
MKKLFFFKSSYGNGTSNNAVPRPASDKQDQREKASGNRMRNQSGDQKGGFPKSQKEVSGGPALRRSLSLSSAAFLVDGFGETSSNDLRQSPCSTTNSHHRQRNHSSRCLTPERCYRERQFEPEYNHKYEGKFPHDSSGSSSSCSSNVSNKVVDRYIDGEEHLERSKQKSSSSHSSISGNSKGRRLPPRGHCVVPISPSDSVKDKQKSRSFREAKGTRLHFPSSDLVDNGFGHESPRALARSVIERLSQTHKSKALNHEPITIQDIYGGSQGKTFDSNSDVTAMKTVQIVGNLDPVNEDHGDDLLGHQQNCLHGKNRYGGSNYTGAEEDADIELRRRYEEAEKRMKYLSEELEQQRSFSNCDVSYLVESLRNLEEERVGLAFEVSDLLRSQLGERTSAREEIRLAKTELDLHIHRLEREKNELQAGLEKELDRRSSDWAFKLEKYQLEEKRLRERVRELAEQNVSLQREVSTFHEKETENTGLMTYLDGKAKELTTKAEDLHEENSYLKQSLSKLQESYEGTAEDLHCLRRNFGEKDKECRDLHKSVTRFLRTCKEQEKTIEGLRNSLSEHNKKHPSEKFDQSVKRLQMEQIRLTGVEFSLRKELESTKVEADSLRHENICLLNRLKGNGEETGISMVKLDNEMKMRVCYLQDQGLAMLNEGTHLCFTLLKFIKGRLSQFPETYQDMQSISNGLAEQFMVESELKVHGIRRGTENLRRNLQTVSVLLHEKSNLVASKSEPSCSDLDRPQDLNNQSREEALQAELRAETLVTSLLREKLYSREQELEQLQGELASSVRGNEILRSEVQATLDNLSVNTHELKDLKLQMLKKEENIRQLEMGLQETNKELAGVRALLQRVSEERDRIWTELKQSSERNMLLNSENEMMRRKVEALDEEVLIKEGQITILKDTLGNKRFDLLISSPDFSKDFLVE